MRGKTTFSLWGFIIIALLLVLFSVQNAQEVGFQFMVWKTHLSLSILLIVAFLLGLIAGVFFSYRRNRKHLKMEKEKDKSALKTNQTTKAQPTVANDQDL
ncbi:LapA family protein [Thermophagus sp. OGC60D27]|uniref:LapA family protein n=1 Tax=Thermophagus sp. OGC60D27 TaxID=3458415 RepID=UPI004037E17F